MAWQIDTAHTSVEFSVRHMAITTVRGRFEKFSGTVEVGPDGGLAGLEATVETASINTREPQRDAHLRSGDFFDADKYPQIRFRSTQVRPVGDHRYKVVGDLTIRDQTHPVELDAETTEIIRDPFGNRRFGLSLQGTISRRQWGLTWNMVLEAGSLMVSDEVRIHVEAEVFTPVEAAAQASG